MSSELRRDKSVEDARYVLRNLATYPKARADDPHGQMDASVLARIKVMALAPKLAREDVKKLLDDVVHGALASDFVVTMLHLALWDDPLNISDDPGSDSGGLKGRQTD